MIVDAHHHLWDLSRREYDWMTDDVAPIRRTFAVADLEAALPPEVTQTIVVQAAHALDETEELLAIASRSERVAGVVGWVDLTRDVPAQIARLRAAPGGDRLVGIRHLVHDEANPCWILRDDVLDGLRAVDEAGLVYDLLLRTRELPAAYDVVRRLPNLSFVVDHGAKPEIARGVTEPWRSLIARLASLPNVACKLSGFVTEASWTSWAPEQIFPYTNHLIGVFGPNRLLFGSDWPVSLLAAPYERVLELARAACADLSTAQQNAIFATNAQRIYRLNGGTR